MGVMQDMSQRFHSRTDPVRGRSPLPGCYVRMPASHRFSTFSAAPRFNLVASHFGPPFHRNIGDRDDFRSRFLKIPAAVRTTSCNTHGHRFGRRTGVRCASKPEESRSRLASRGLRIRLVSALRERSRPAPAFQLLDFRAQLLNHPMLVQDDLNQFVAAQ
jgi:hypothetical protein